MPPSPSCRKPPTPDTGPKEACEGLLCPSGGGAWDRDCRENTSCPCAVWHQGPPRGRRMGPVVLCPLTSGTMDSSPWPRLGRLRAAAEPPPNPIPPTTPPGPPQSQSRLGVERVQKCSSKTCSHWERKSQGLLASPE